MLSWKDFEKYKLNKAIEYRDTSGNVRVTTYDELWSNIGRVADLLNRQSIHRQLITVQLPHTPELIAVICGIHRSSNGFYCTNIEEKCDHVRERTVNYCITYTLNSPSHYTQAKETFTILGQRLTLWESLVPADTATECKHTHLDICFAVRTSGSTGKPKFVMVPLDCILPNLVELGAMFRLQSTDIVFISSPPTFDPFVVDVFLTLRAGACMLLVSNDLRLSPEQLLVVFEHKPTYMQMTPSLFTRWPRQQMEEVILAPNTSLRTLVLGGEPFPKLHFPKGCPVHIYNIYGITEVSCWSTIQHIPLDAYNVNSEVSLGSPIDATIELQLRSLDTGKILPLKCDDEKILGQLYIGSKTRKCIIADALNPSPTEGNETLFRSTGDVVECRSCSDGTLCDVLYKGRCNEIVKRFGVAVSLRKLEMIITAHSEVEQAAVISVGPTNRLVVFYQTIASGFTVAEVWRLLRKAVGPLDLPDEVLRIAAFPLSMHGKVSKRKLAELYQQLHSNNHREASAVEYLQREIHTMLSVECSIPDAATTENPSKRMKLLVEQSFLASGGTSLMALRLHQDLEQTYGIDLPKLVGKLLDTTVSLTSVFQYLADAANKPCATEPFIVNPSLRLSVISKHNLEKCIDAQPTLGSFGFYENGTPIVSVGSHAHLVVTVNARTDALLSRLVLPDRVEGSVSFLDSIGLAVVGCYDGKLYCFNPLSGNISWTYDAGGMIKSKPLIMTEPTLSIVIGSYGEQCNLHCLLENGTLEWSIKLGTKAILSSPLNVGDGRIFVATLDGTVGSICSRRGKVVWTRKCDSPIFSTVARMDDRIIVAEVAGTIHLYDRHNGVELSNITMGGNLFSSFDVSKSDLNGLCMFFGCYDGFVYCVESDASEKLSIRWKIQASSQIYATPIVLNYSSKDILLVCCTNGLVQMISLETVSLVGELQLGGELFSSPISIGDGMIFVGCRDNYLYKLKLHFDE